MSYIGLLEYDYGYHYDHNGRTAPQSERRYILPMFVPGSAELFNMEETPGSTDNKRLKDHPDVASFFERMTYIPLAGITQMVPPGGAGVCTTKCAFDAITLHREHPECSEMTVAEDKFKKILPYQAKRAIRIALLKKN